LTRTELLWLAAMRYRCSSAHHSQLILNVSFYISF
jgi:hypothetical protein